MSFSQDVKREIIDNRPLRQHHKEALSYGLFSNAHRFSEQEISIRTRQKEVAEYFCWLAKSNLGKETTTKLSELKTKATPVYRAWLPLEEERKQLLTQLQLSEKTLDLPHTTLTQKVYAYLAGAFLACGNITDPEKGYHVEYVVRRQKQKKELEHLLMAYAKGFRSTERRGATVFYCKEVGNIQDFLTMVGASKAALAVIEIEMIKDVRNLANRQTNCETANISKQVSASTEQIMDIQLIEKKQGLDSLTPALQETAYLRLEHPEVSLRELCELSPSQVSRSGLYHRLRSISNIAQQIRDTNDKKESANV